MTVDDGGEGEVWLEMTSLFITTFCYFDNNITNISENTLIVIQFF